MSVLTLVAVWVFGSLAAGCAWCVYVEVCRWRNRRGARWGGWS